MDQETAAKYITHGYNVFLTGKPGTGKTYLLNDCIAYFNNIEMNIAITATTGMAAVAIGGVTIHSWAGIGIKTEEELSKVETLNGIAYRPAIRDRIGGCEILIIDEISMMHKYVLDAVDKICQKVKKDSRPFGGMQVIMAGDMFQLAPVRGTDKDFAYNATSWFMLKPVICYLDKVYRQEDVDFLELLDEIRSNTVSRKSLILLNTRCAKPSNKDTFTTLYSKNIDVDTFNSKKLDAIPGSAHNFKYNILEDDPFLLKALKKYCPSPEVLKLKVGAIVMFTHNNLKEGYVNGTLGEVIGYEGYSKNPVVKTLKGKEISVGKHKWSMSQKEYVKTGNKIEDENGKEVDEYTEVEHKASLEQIPLRLAWAITTHRCVAGNTLVVTSKGLEYMKNIVGNIPEKSFEEADFFVHGKNGEYKADQIYNGGVVDCIKITTESGYSLTGSKKHPVLVRTSEGEEVWKKMPELVVGDVLILQKGTYAGCVDNLAVDTSLLSTHHTVGAYSFPKKMSTDLAWFLGAVIGNGNVTDKKEGRVELIDLSIQLIDRFVNITENLFSRKVSVRKRDKVYSAYFHSVLVRNLLEQIGLTYSKSISKTTPYCILTSSIEYQKAYIQGLFDTDGGVNKSSVHYTSASEQLVDEIQQILLNLGITASKRKIQTGYRIQISGYNATKFINTINFFREDKKIKGKKRYLVLNNKTPKIQKGFFPDSQKFTNKLYNDMLSVYGIPYGNIKRLHLPDKLHTIFSNKLNNKSKLAPEHIEFLIKELPEFFEKKEFICYKQYANYVFEKIATIGDCKEQVFDIHVPKDHTYLGNGIVNHNSQGMTLDAAYMDISDTFVDGMGYVALSRVKSLEGLYIKGFSLRSLKVNSNVLEHDQNFRYKAAIAENNADNIVNKYEKQLFKSYAKHAAAI